MLSNNKGSEILLRDKEFCNLTEVISRSTDTVNTLKEKIELATILGTIQSTFTNFDYVSEIWKSNCEEERLLGVSLTGIMDNPILSNTKNVGSTLEILRDYARSVNKEWSKALGINESTAITTVKPSGTVSELVGASPGIHPRYSRYYIRSIRQDNADPYTQALKDMGVKWEVDLMKPNTGTVFYFPQEAPENSVFRDDRTAIEQLEHWLVFQRYWCEHKPSITVYVKEHEWLEVAAWVYKHFDEVSGISFLPHSDHTYKQAPFTEVSKEEWEALKATTPTKYDFSNIIEEEDTTKGSQELACSSGVCSII
jgi:ribonucleoside-diphosphate reductase alpha chain